MLRIVDNNSSSVSVHQPGPARECKETSANGSSRVWSRLAAVCGAAAAGIGLHSLFSGQSGSNSPKNAKNPPQTNGSRTASPAPQPLRKENTSSSSQVMTGQNPPRTNEIPTTPGAAQTVKERQGAVRKENIPSVLQSKTGQNPPQTNEIPTTPGTAQTLKKTKCDVSKSNDSLPLLRIVPPPPLVPPFSNRTGSSAFDKETIRSWGELALDAAPWVIGTLITIWFVKRHFFNNPPPLLPPPLLPRGGAFGGPGSFPLDVPSKGSLNVLDVPIYFLSPLDFTLPRTLEENLAQFDILLQTIERMPYNEALADLSKLFQTMQTQLEESLSVLDENSFDRILEISEQQNKLQKYYDNAVNWVRTHYPLVQIPQTARAGEKEKVESISEKEAQAELQRLEIGDIRRIAGDGNCFYTSFATLLFEAVAANRFVLSSDWLNRHFIIPDYPNQELLRFVQDLLQQARDPSELQAILQDSNRMLPMVRYLRDLAAYSIQRGWLWDSITQSPEAWLGSVEVAEENLGILAQIRESLQRIQAVHMNEDLAQIFAEYAAQLDGSQVNQDPIVTLLLCILDRSLIQQIVTARGIDPDSLYSIRFLLTDSRFRELEERFNRMQPNSDQRRAYEACRDALNLMQARFQELRGNTESPAYQSLLSEMMSRPGGGLLHEQAEGWRAALIGEYEDPGLVDATIDQMIERYLSSMGVDAMQQTIEALSRQLDFPIEINLLGAFSRTLPSTIDGKVAQGAVVRAGRHYFVGYRGG